MLKKKLFGIKTLFVGLMLVMALTITFTACPNGTTNSGNTGNTTCTSHNWGSWTLTTPPTALPITGVETRTCSSCSKSETRSLTEAAFRTYFYDTWINNPMEDGFTSNQIVINQNLFHLTTNNVNMWKKFDPVTWEAFVNPIAATQAAYPVGFKLGGTLTHQSFSAPNIFIALSNNGNTMLVNWEASSTGAQRYYTRQ